MLLLTKCMDQVLHVLFANAQLAGASLPIGVGFFPPALPFVVPKSFTLGACGFSRPLKPDLVQFLWLPGTIVPGYFQPPYGAEG